MHSPISGAAGILILCGRQFSVVRVRQTISRGQVMKKRWRKPATEGRLRNGEAGFTLMELLIVMAV
ncbi:MAG TPA: prepilin-type N-terminal cleavage/methylation domain-containing protein, partial [Acidobacteriaceae bacterium]|nr:prepilin-type N-terminal cleavage/methylation domain-containing protein [Acidobacteriaceae bacterium]